MSTSLKTETAVESKRNAFARAKSQHPTSISQLDAKKIMEKKEISEEEFNKVNDFEAKVKIEEYPIETLEDEERNLNRIMDKISYLKSIKKKNSGERQELL